MKRSTNQALKLYRTLTARLRVVPDFIIIGTQRGGTTSLYNNLIKHPCIVPAFKKEVHFFDVNFRKGISWYQTHFPSYIEKYLRKAHAKDFVTGEASPYYMFHPHVPRRIAEMVPKVKLIALLRNPVDRAYSHYHHEVRIGFETRSFAEAVDSECEMLSVETKRLMENEDYNSTNHRHCSYLSRGVYIEQLKALRSYFTENQILILKSEDFYCDPSNSMQQVLDFLGLSLWEPATYRKYNNQLYSELGVDIRTRLAHYFKPYNQQLYDYLGVDLGWEHSE